MRNIQTKIRKEQLSSQCLLLCTSANIILKVKLCVKRGFLKCYGWGIFWCSCRIIMHLQDSLRRQINNTSGKKCSPRKHISDLSSVLFTNLVFLQAFRHTGHSPLLSIVFLCQEVLKCFMRSSSSLIILTFCIDFLSAKKLK